MSVTVKFRVVGVYLSFPEITIDDLDATSTVKEVMDNLQFNPTTPGFKYLGVGSPELVHTIAYDFTKNSIVPINSKFANEGPNEPDRDPQYTTRVLGEIIDMSGISRVWQYYRSITLFFGDESIKVRLPTNDQAAFAEVPLNRGVGSNAALVGLIAKSDRQVYDIVWRCVSIKDMDPQTGEEYNKMREGSAEKVKAFYKGL